MGITTWLSKISKCECSLKQSVLFFTLSCKNINFLYAFIYYIAVSSHLLGSEPVSGLAAELV